MLQLTTHRDVDTWRSLARGLLATGVPPDAVLWADGPDDGSLLGTSAEPPPPLRRGQPGEVPAAVVVPREFVDLAAAVGCHRDPDRWNLLYRAVWRITRGGERHLLERPTDDDVHRLRAMERAVRRDRHKMTAFVRFRLVPPTAAAAGDAERYVAWHRPDHYIVRLTAPFFRSRFATLRWTILTPDDSAAWDGERLHFGPGVPESQAPAGDDLEALWRTYYANIFNPARIKVRAMKRELPVRHWPTLPETQLIPDLLNDAPRRVREMIRKARQAAEPGAGRTQPVELPSVAEGEPVTLFEPTTDAGPAPREPSRGRAAGWGAEPFIPASRELPVLAAAAKGCRGCDLCDVGTQTVFGEGPPDARVVFVGEQPGDQEDVAGRPFVGPAGRLFDEALARVGIDRAACYVTNTVKHFKWVPRGARRVHAKPSAREVAACLPWLGAELQVVKPGVLVCLGSTAAQALLGRDFRVTERRGQPFESPWAPWTIATLHPSALLRIPDEGLRERSHRQFVEDLRLVAGQAARGR